MNNEELLLFTQLQSQQHSLKKRLEETERWQTYEAEGLSPEKVVELESARLDKIYEDSCKAHEKMRRTIRPSAIISVIAILAGWAGLTAAGLIFLEVRKTLSGSEARGVFYSV